MQSKCVKKNAYTGGRNTADQEEIIQHMSNHYRRVLNAKKAVDNSPPHSYKARRVNVGTSTQKSLSNTSTQESKVSMGCSETPSSTSRSQSTNSCKNSCAGPGSYVSNSRYHSGCVPQLTQHPIVFTYIEMDLIHRITYDTKNGPAAYSDKGWQEVKATFNGQKRGASLSSSSTRTQQSCGKERTASPPKINLPVASKAATQKHSFCFPEKLRPIYVSKKPTTQRPSTQDNARPASAEKETKKKYKFLSKEKLTPVSKAQSKTDPIFAECKIDYQPIVLQTSAESKLKNSGVYYPPRRKKVGESKNPKTIHSPMKISTKCQCMNYCICSSVNNPDFGKEEGSRKESQTSSRDSAYNGGLASLPESRTPSPDHEDKKPFTCAKERDSLSFEKTNIEEEREDKGEEKEEGEDKDEDKGKGKDEVEEDYEERDKVEKEEDEEDYEERCKVEKEEDEEDYEERNKVEKEEDKEDYEERCKVEKEEDEEDYEERNKVEIEEDEEDYEERNKVEIEEDEEVYEERNKVEIEEDEEVYEERNKVEIEEDVEIEGVVEETKKVNKEADTETKKMKEHQIKEDEDEEDEKVEEEDEKAEEEDEKAEEEDEKAEEEDEKTEEEDTKTEEEDEKTEEEQKKKIEEEKVMEKEEEEHENETVTDDSESLRSEKEQALSLQSSGTEKEEEKDLKEKELLQIDKVIFSKKESGEIDYPLDLWATEFEKHEEDQKKILREIKEEGQYINFIQKITSEILEKCLYTNKSLTKVMKRHLINNLHKLDKNRMLKELEKLRMRLGIPEDSSLLDLEKSVVDSATDLLECAPALISDTEFLIPSHLTRSQENAAKGEQPCGSTLKEAAPLKPHVLEFGKTEGKSSRKNSTDDSEDSSPHVKNSSPVKDKKSALLKKRFSPSLSSSETDESDRKPTRTVNEQKNKKADVVLRDQNSVEIKQDASPRDSMASGGDKKSRSVSFGNKSQANITTIADVRHDKAYPKKMNIKK